MSGGEAAKIALKAIGAQDAFLLSDEPEHSLFHYSGKQHSQFLKYHRSKNMKKPGTAQPNWPFADAVFPGVTSQRVPCDWLLKTEE